MLAKKAGSLPVLYIDAGVLTKRALPKDFSSFRLGKPSACGAIRINLPSLLKSLFFATSIIRPYTPDPRKAGVIANAN